GPDVGGARTKNCPPGPIDVTRVAVVEVSDGVDEGMRCRHRHGQAPAPKHPCEPGKDFFGGGVHEASSLSRARRTSSMSLRCLHSAPMVAEAEAMSSSPAPRWCRARAQSR